MRFFVRWCLLWIFLVAVTGVVPAADDGSAPRPRTVPETLASKPRNVVKEFSGSGSTTTGFFEVRDHWEVRWNALQVVSVAVMSADGSIVAGGAGVLRGSLFVPLGGKYYLKISDGTVRVRNSSETNSMAATNAASAPMTNAAPTGDTNAPSVQTNAASAGATNALATTTTNAPAAAPEDSADTEPMSWHVQVVQLGASVRARQSLTVYTPYFMVPDSAITPEAPPPPPPVLTNEEARTVVRIRGDKASGAGFLLRTPDGSFVVTHLHLLAANPNVRLFTTSGTEITPLGLKGAIDRDLAMFSIKDENFTYLPPCTDPANKINTGEPLIIPDLAGQTDPMLGKPGQLLGISAEHVDFDNPMGPGSAGAPVIIAKKGTALAIVTAVKKVDVSELLARAWPANPPPGSAGIIPYFGLRLTGVQGWQMYDPQQFLNETVFLKQFHTDTRCLDSFLNGRKHRDSGEDENTGAPDTRFYLHNDKLSDSFDTYRHFATGADRNQRMEAAHELLFDLMGIAQADVTTLQGMTSLYAYDQVWAKEEMAYRMAIKNELNDLSNNLDRLDNIAKERLAPPP